MYFDLCGNNMFHQQGFHLPRLFIKIKSIGLSFTNLSSNPWYSHRGWESFLDNLAARFLSSVTMDWPPGMIDFGIANLIRVDVFFLEFPGFPEVSVVIVVFRAMKCCKLLTFLGFSWWAEALEALTKGLLPTTTNLTNVQHGILGFGWIWFVTSKHIQEFENWTAE